MGTGGYNNRSNDISNTSDCGRATADSDDSFRSRPNVVFAFPPHAQRGDPGTGTGKEVWATSERDERETKKEGDEKPEIEIGRCW